MAQATFSFDALGTRWWIHSDTPLLARHKTILRQTVETFESNYSRFRPDSFIGQLNDAHVLVSDSAELRKMLDFALSMYDATDGIFNITIGSQLEQSGYGRVPAAGARISTHLRKDITWDATTIHTAKHVRLDFGGFGKAWLIDALAAQLDILGHKNFTVNGGGDIFVSDQQDSVIIEHPLQTSLAIGEVRVHNASICSSSVHKRMWRAPDGSSATHIQSAEQGEPQHDIASMHVRAGTALLADVFATVFLLVPHERRRDLAAHFDLSFMEVHRNGTFWQTPEFGFVPYRADKNC